MYDRILVRFGDLTLKGKNQSDFIRQLYKLLDEKRVFNTFFNKNVLI